LGGDVILQGICLIQLTQNSESRLEKETGISANGLRVDQRRTYRSTIYESGQIFLPYDSTRLME